MVSRSVGQHHGDLRATVVQRAIDALEGGRGVELSMRELARTVGVSPGAIYHHFADRAALLDALAQEGFLRLGRVQARVESRSGVAHLENLITAYMRFAGDHPSLYRVMFNAVTDGAATASAETTHAAAATFDRLVAVVAATNGSLDHNDAHIRALMIWTLTHGAVELAQWSRRLDPRFTSRRIIEEASRSAHAIASAPLSPDR
jgi:AcrR family transcriptional regulator